MAKRGLSEDTIKLILDGESSKLQQAAHQASKAIRQLESDNKQLLDRQNQMRKAKITEGKEWDELSKRITENDQKIRQHKADLQGLTQAMGINTMTMTQLRKEAKQLQRQMDSTSKELEPRQWQEFSDKLTEVKKRMAELSGQSKQLGYSFEAQVKGILTSTVITRAYDFLKGKMTDIISTSVEMAEQADGVTHAFRQIDGNDELLQNLRTATKGTVNDFELMKAAMKARDFKIPLEDLGTLLQFAQLKAQQTGQSVDYMVDSIVTGLGRQSKPILDNLGISAAELDSKIQETGDFAKAVAAIVQQQLADAGEQYVSAADRALQKQTELQNQQLQLGEDLMEVKQQFTNAYGEVIITLMKVLSWIMQNKKTALSLISTVTLLTLAIKANAIATKGSAAAHAAWRSLMVTGRAAGLLYATVIALITGNTQKATIAMRAFSIAVKSNPIGLAATLILAAGAALTAYVSSSKKASDATRKLSEAQQQMLSNMRRARQQMAESQKALATDISSVEKTANEQVAEQTTRLKTLQKTLNDNTKALSARYSALQEIKKIVPAYHAQLTTEGVLINNNTSALDAYITNLRKAAQAQAVISKLTEIEKESLDLSLQMDSSKNRREDLERQMQERGFDPRRQSVVNRGGTRYIVDNSNRQGAGTPDIMGVGDLSAQWWDLLLADSHTRQLQQNNNRRRQQLTDYAQKNGLDLSATPTPPTTYTPPPTKSGTPDKDPAPDKLRSQRQQLLSEETTFNAGILNAYKKMLSDKKISQAEYDAAQLALTANHNDRLLDMERQHLDEIKQTTFKDAKEKEKAISDQQRNVEKAERDSEAARLAAYQNYRQQLEQIDNASLSDAERQQRDHQLQLAALEGYYKASLQYAETHGQDTVAIEDAYQKARAKLISDYNTKSEEERLKVRQQYGLVSQQELYDQELAQLKEHLAKKEITEDEYQKARLQMAIDRYKKEFDYYSNLVGGAVSALQDAELANVNAKYDAEIEAARKAGKDTTDLENKKADEQLKIQKKYADVNFAIKASQIIADTATSIMKAYADLGPVAGTVAAVLMGVTGAAQLAAANAERQRVKNMTLSGSKSSGAGARVATGLEDGGYVDVERRQDGRLFHAQYDPRRRGFVSRPTVIVGEGPQSKEWVASNAAVENPTVRPVIEAIDRAQRANRLRTFDLKKYLLRDQTRGLSTGGSVNPAYTKPVMTSGSTSHGGTDSATIARLIAILERLERRGIPATVGLDQIDAAQRLLNQSRDVAKKE